MTLEELRSLLTQLSTNSSVTAKQRKEQITAATGAMTDEQIISVMDEIRAQVGELKGATPSTEVLTTLRDLKEVRGAVLAEQGTRAETAAQLASEATGLLEELDAEPETPTEKPADPETPEQDTPPVAPERPAKTPTGPVAPSQLPGENGEQAPAESPALEAVAASLASLAEIMKQGFTAAAPKPEVAPEPEDKPTGRAAGRIGQHTPTSTPTVTQDAVTLRVHAAGSDGSRQHGQALTSTAELGRVFADRLRGANGGGGNGRQYVARVDFEYPESRRLMGPDADSNDNFTKIERVTSDTALVASGGLCAPLQVLYDVEVIGSTARPVRDALARFTVDRGGIQYRPNMSAAAAVYGAAVWTLAEDAADPVGSKGCYVVDCPGVVNATIEAIYLCLEFGNISTRFDPEVTAANVQKGMIAHARVAENELLAAIAAGSKILSAPKVIGATRDILVNFDKAIAYYRNRHRLTDNLPLTCILPAWVKSMMRADIARQIAAGDWINALSVSDAMIESWFGTRNVTPVWHLDGPSGTNEVQTVTITGTPTGGTFTLTYSGQTTSAIAYNASAATVQSALEALSNIVPGDILVGGGPGPGTPYTVTFGFSEAGGQFHGANVAQMTASGAGFTGGSSPAIAVTTTTGGGGAITVAGVSIASQTYPDAAAGGTIPSFPDQIDALLFASGTWLFLDGGSLDLGLVRDSLLNDRNRYRQFMETFEGTANRGIESLRLAMTVQPTGQTSGTADLSAIAD